MERSGAEAAGAALRDVRPARHFRRRANFWCQLEYGQGSVPKPFQEPNIAGVVAQSI